MAIIEFTVEKAEATATPKFVLFESAADGPDGNGRDFDASISKPESTGPGLGPLLLLAGLAVAVWVAHRWL